MHPLPRFHVSAIAEDLQSKMVFVSGPRQVGKTTLSRQVIERTGGISLNYDNAAERRSILKAQWPAGAPVVALDEIHKYARWKRFLKGEFDTHRDRFTFLVTGSARLDVYRRGGDSLQGRYHLYRLHPFSVCELAGLEPHPPEPGSAIESDSAGTSTSTADALGALLRFGGFPEPCLAGSERVWRRWSREHTDRVVREEVRDLSRLHDIDTVGLLADMLPSRVGSPLSLNSLRNDLEVAHRTAQEWVRLLESLYFCHRIAPYSSAKHRSLRKEPKLYMWDWSAVDEPGARFENLIAGHLLKFCHHMADTEGHSVDLWYLRDRDGREVDFLVTHNRKPWFAVECKLKGDAVGHLPYYAQRLNIPHSYLVHAEPDRHYIKDGLTVVPAQRFLSALGV